MTAVPSSRVTWRRDADSVGDRSSGPKPLSPAALQVPEFTRTPEFLSDLPESRSVSGTHKHERYQEITTKYSGRYSMTTPVHSNCPPDRYRPLGYEPSTYSLIWRNLTPFLG